MLPSGELEANGGRIGRITAENQERRKPTPEKRRETEAKRAANRRSSKGHPEGEEMTRKAALREDEAAAEDEGDERWRRPKGMEIEMGPRRAQVKKREREKTKVDGGEVLNGRRQLGKSSKVTEKCGLRVTKDEPRTLKGR